MPESRDEADPCQLATKADVRADIDGLRLFTKADLAEFKAEMIKWLVGIAFAQSALIVTLLKLFPGR